ncbi:hypothetical protein BASA81_001819 [Batrachochytrium salamandrivorans]|nr:hypothetical protein BASA81_001819 [Batrachochytrium salamandrivorans]
MLDRSTAMRLEMQLFNTSAWRKLADEDGGGGFPELITKGSSKLDLVMLRATCPYLFGIWSGPLFTAQARLQPDSQLLHMLDETTLGLVFCFLTERELAAQVAPTCTMFRASLFSKWHMESLLGGAMSSSITNALACGNYGQGPNVPQLADRLRELNHTVGMGFSQIAVAQGEAAQSQVEIAMCDLFHRVPDCQVRLRKLELALLARASLQTHERQVDKLLAGCDLLLDPASPARRALDKLLAVGLAFGNRFGGPVQPQPGVQTFVLTGLTQLHESKSRFHRQLTLAEVFVWLIGEAGGGEEEFASLESSLRMWNGPNANMVMEAATTTCLTLANLKDTELDLGGVQDNFHSRLDRVLRLFDSACRELLAKIARARSQLASVTKLLLPDSPGALSAGKEITELYHFARFCLDRMRCHNREEATCYELREQAWKNTALESSAIGKNASQRALRIQSQPEMEKSSEFLHARGAVNANLSGAEKEEAARQAREERMERVAETLQALSVEERAARESLLRSTLQFKPSLVRQEREQEEEEQEDGEQEDGEQEEEEQEDGEQEEEEQEKENADNGLKLWYWTSSYSPSRDSIWGELSLRPSSLSDHDVALITKLFSRGPEVHLTAATTHQRLKHFTGADFSNSKTIITNSSVVDVKRTGKALDALPQVQLLGGSPAKPVAVGRSDLPPALPVFPLSRILALKQQGKLGTAQLQPQQLEWHLSEDEFVHCFAMSRQAFLTLPAWKRDKAKKECGLF